MTAGQEFVKKIRPLGAIFFIAISALFIVIGFTAGTNPIPGYEPPHDSAYFAQNVYTLKELQKELQTNVFPHLEGVISSEVKDDRLKIIIASERFATTRSAILRFFDESLFELVPG